MLTFLAGCPYTCLNLLERIPRKFILAAGFWHMLVSNISTNLYSFATSVSQPVVFLIKILRTHLTKMYKWQNAIYSGVQRQVARSSTCKTPPRYLLTSSPCTLTTWMLPWLLGSIHVSPFFTLPQSLPRRKALPLPPFSFSLLLILLSD